VNLRYAVLADDLTGACDAGTKFALEGLSVRLELGEPDASTGDVLVYNTESRMLPPREAHDRLRAAARATLAAGASTIYKKVDSTLRGSVGAEIEGVLEALPGHSVLLCPAFPAQQRAVVGGHLLVDGIPVSRTALARDPVTPVRESHIPTLLTEQSGRRAGVVDLSCVAAGVEAVIARLRELIDGGATVVVADAMQDSDLHCLAQAAVRMNRGLLPCGSAGLAAALAPHWRDCAGKALAGRREESALTSEGRIVAAIGSIHPAAIEQAEVLCREAGWPLVRVDQAAALAGGNVWREWLAAARAKLEAASAQAAGAVLTIEAGRQPREVALLFAESLAELAAAALEATEASGAVLTGGDTASAVLGRIGARHVQLLDELEPGIPVGRVLGGRHDGLAVVTKAGGFGRPDALWRAARYLNNGG
jgi:uncharacterized protein YgbK (DUF1537 family)